MALIQQIPLFSEYLYITNYKLDIETMISKLYQLKEIDKGNVISNVGGWQGSTPLYQYTEFYSIVDLVKDFSKHTWGKDIQFEDMGFWGNISSTTNYNKVHGHGTMGPGIMSGVYYLQVSNNSGNIKFYDNLLINEFEYAPKVGDLLLFPPTSYHSVLPNMDEKDRISIAFNFKFL